MNKKEISKELQSGKFVGPLLVTTDNWFLTEKGEFRGAFGKARLIKAENIFGFVPVRSTDWALEFEGGLIVFGCQVHYIKFVGTKKLKKCKPSRIARNKIWCK